MSKDYFNPPLKQLFELAPGTLDHSVQVNYESFINEGGTVFEMLKMGRQGVVDAFGLHSRQAQVLLDKAMSLAVYTCLLYTSPSPRDGLLSRMPSSA